jgi:alpha-galactosidase
MKILTTTLLFLLAIAVTGQDKKLLAPSPPMGWNSWNWFGKKEINEQNMKECIDAMVDQGLAAAGYNYFVIDGGWRDTKLGPNGELLAHPVKFPHGMKALADYAHAKGLKFGLHTVPGTHDCGGDPVGGFGHEEIQIKQFVDWGLDFIKLDKCRYAKGWNETLLKETYKKWRQLLDASGRDIVLSISAYKWRDWNPEIGQMARTTGDIRARVSKGAVFDALPLSVMGISDENNKLAAHGGNGFWNDPDMLATGEQGLTVEEQKTHFALWCIMSSPLMLGNDPRNMTSGEKAILLNKEAIAVNQDPTEQGSRLKNADKVEVWLKHLKDGKLALLFLNGNEDARNKLTFQLSELGIEKDADLTEIFSQKKIKNQKGKITIDLAPHSCSFMLDTVKK